MKMLPRFKEDVGLKSSGSISLVENMDVLSEADAKLLSTYMESCAVIDEWLSNIKNPITNRLEIPNRTWSDGDYVWDSAHIFYVAKYHARLPAEFMEHVKRQVESGFDAKVLDSKALREEFELVLPRLIAGDESYYANY